MIKYESFDDEQAQMFVDAVRDRSVVELEDGTKCIAVNMEKVSPYRYLVEYQPVKPDIYYSWKKEEKIMNFGEALNLLKQGKKLRRKGWNGKGIFIALHEQRDSDDMADYIYIDTTGLSTDNERAPKNRVPWLGSQTDLLADDWERVPSILDYIDDGSENLIKRTTAKSIRHAKLSVNPNVVINVSADKAIGEQIEKAVQNAFDKSHQATIESHDVIEEKAKHNRSVTLKSPNQVTNILLPLKKKYTNSQVLDIQRALQRCVNSGKIFF